MVKKTQDGEEGKGKLIGDKLTEIMRKQNVSVTELADATGLRINTISRLKNNQNGVSGGSLLKICEVLGVSAAVFEDGNEELMLNTMIVKALSELSEDIVDVIIDALGDKRKLEFMLEGIKIADEFSLTAEECHAILTNMVRTGLEIGWIKKG